MTMMTSKSPDIFISRKLEEDSILLDYFKSKKLSFLDQSLIEFSPVKFERPWSEWLFFYSKKGVRYYFDQQPPQRMRSHKLACFGPGTASYLLDNYGFMPDFIGTGEKEATTLGLLNTAANESVCFVVGRQSLRSVQAIIGEKLEWTEICVYDNTPAVTPDLSTYKTAIITSPMNYESFVTNGGSADHIISIGASTSQKIKEISSAKAIHQTDEPSELSILNTFRELR